MRGEPAIKAFAEKLRLALGRANLSHAQLAQAIEVDKSVVSRWLNGALQPSDHSLTALTAVLAKSVPRFDRLTWDGTATEFGQRLGVGTAAPQRAPGDFPILPRAKESTEPPRVCRRPHGLRGWGHDEEDIEPVFA